MDVEEGARKFASGFLTHYQPDIKKLEQKLYELTTNQKVVLNDIQAENLKFSSVDTNELHALFGMIKEYHIKLMNIKREMSFLAEKSVKLKKRAFRLQEYKQKEALENAHYREAQLKREQDLIAHSSSS